MYILVYTNIYLYTHAILVYTGIYHTSIYSDKPGTYWYILVCTRKIKMVNEHNVWIRTENIMHSIQLP